MKGANPRAVVCRQETRSVWMSLSSADIIARSTSVFTSSRPEDNLQSQSLNCEFLKVTE